MKNVTLRKKIVDASSSKSVLNKYPLANAVDYIDDLFYLGEVWSKSIKESSVGKSLTDSQIVDVSRPSFEQKTIEKIIATINGKKVELLKKNYDFDRGAFLCTFVFNSGSAKKAIKESGMSIDKSQGFVMAYKCKSGEEDGEFYYFKEKKNKNELSESGAKKKLCNSVWLVFGVNDLNVMELGKSQRWKDYESIMNGFNALADALTTEDGEFPTENTLDEIMFDESDGILQGIKTFRDDVSDYINEYYVNRAFPADPTLKGLIRDTNKFGKMLNDYNMVGNYKEMSLSEFKLITKF